MNKDERRFFLFSYSYPSGNGNLNVRTDKKDFPSKEFLKKEMSGMALCKPNEICIFGWNEFKNEADYNAFNG